MVNASSVSGDKLPLLYGRIGAGGKPLSNEERLFSLYKYHQPVFHDIVRNIYYNEKCGRVMVPSRIAASAIRIANAQAHQKRDEQQPGNARPDEGNGIPDVNEFARAVRQDPTDQNGVYLRACLDELLGISDGNEEDDGLFSRAFIKLFDALRYHKENNPLGLPMVLLWRLPPSLIQVLLFWIVRDQNEEPLCSSELIRFVMHWLLCSHSDDKISSRCFTRIRKSSAQGRRNQISLEALVAAVQEDPPLVLKLIAPDKMHELLVCEEPREWKSLSDRIKGEEWDVSEVVSRWWSDQNTFLPWLQRAYLGAAFPDFDPTADREDDTPYEVDHMVPSSDWGFAWWNRDEKLPEEARLQESLRWVRFEIGNTIGSKWLVDGSVNCSWSNVSFTEKINSIRLRMNDPTDATEALLDVFERDVSLEQLWKTASPEGTHLG